MRFGKNIIYNYMFTYTCVHVREPVTIKIHLNIDTF